MDSSALFNAYLNTVLRSIYAPMPHLLMPMFGLPMMPANVFGPCPTHNVAVPMYQAQPAIKPLQKPSAVSSEESPQSSPPSQAPPLTHHVAAAAQPTVKPSRKSPFSILEPKMTDAPSSSIPTPESKLPPSSSLPALPMPSALPSVPSTKPSPPCPAPPAVKVCVEFTAEIKKILHDWFDAHLDYPYPSKHDVQLLTEKTPLTKTQV
uniref:Homeobox_KN domain-containing protein n=1 Tax=Panagrellus redivivus TaxID=6233 RepID=A0A7E4VED1_PANRE